MISVCFLFFKIPLPRLGSYPSIVIPTGAKHRIQSPLERWPRRISTDRPEMESRPYECLLHFNSLFSTHLPRLAIISGFPLPSPFQGTGPTRLSPRPSALILPLLSP